MAVLAAFLLGWLPASPAAAQGRKGPSVARAHFQAEGRAQGGGTCFFLPVPDEVRAAAVCTAHAFDLDELALAERVEFRLGATKRRVAASSKLFAKAGRSFSLPGSSLAEDLMIFKLEAPPAEVAVLAAARAKPSKGDRVRILGIPAGGDVEEAELLGTIFSAESGRIEVDLDRATTLHGWGGGPALNEAGELIGLLQAALGARVTLTPVGAVLNRISNPVTGDASAFGGAKPPPPLIAETRPGRPPSLERGAAPERPSLSGPNAPQQAPDDVSVKLEVEYPPNDSIVGDPLGAFVAGKAYALEGRLRRFDVIFVVDTSGSTKELTGTDVNGNGVVGRQGFFGASDDGDSILAAEISAALQMLRGFDPRSTRVGVISFAGDPQTGFPPRRTRDAAITEEPLTSDFEQVSYTLRKILSRKPEGMTHMAAGVDQATIELLGLRGGLSEPDPSSEKVVLFFTDGRPTLPYDQVFEAENVKAVLRAADRSARANIKIHSFAIGPEALEGPVATVEMAARTEGYFTPVRDPGELVDVIDTVSFANVDRLTVENQTAGTPAQDAVISADGSWSSLVALEPGKNRIEVTAEASDGSQVRDQLVLHYAPDAPSPELPREFVPRRNQLLEQRLVELKRASDALVEETRRELKVEIERERAIAQERAERQRKELDIRVDPKQEPKRVSAP